MQHGPFLKHYAAHTRSCTRAEHSMLSQENDEALEVDIEASGKIQQPHPSTGTTGDTPNASCALRCLICSQVLPSTVNRAPE